MIEVRKPNLSFLDQDSLEQTIKTIEEIAASRTFVAKLIVVIISMGDAKGRVIPIDSLKLFSEYL